MRALLIALALALTGCVAGGVETPADSPPAQDAGGAGETQRLAAAYVGLEQEEALALAEERGVSARVGTAADVGQPGQTDDYEVGRLTFVVSDGVVAEVVVETETGPETVAAS